MKDEETIAAYNQKVDEYASLVSSDKPDLDAQAFLDSLPDNAFVLDLGCGPGNSAKFFKDAGHVVDAIDASEEMVKLASSKHGLNARVGTFEDVQETNHYDAVWANFSLLHAPKDKFPVYLQAIHRALKPDGIFHIGMKLGSDSRRDNLGRLYAYYSREELEALLQNNGFVASRNREGEDVGLAGDLDRWIVIQSKAKK